MWCGSCVSSHVLHQGLYKAPVFGLANTNSLRKHLSSQVLTPCLRIQWHLHSRGQWTHVWTFTSHALNPTWMKLVHSINSAHRRCLESWVQFMPRKLKAIKNTFYAKFETPRLKIHLHSCNCIDSYKTSSHLVQKSERSVRPLYLSSLKSFTEMCTDLCSAPVQQKACCSLTSVTLLSECVSTSTAKSQHDSPLRHKVHDIMQRKVIRLLILK